MLKKLFKKQREALDYFFTHLDIGQCEKVFAEILRCSGIIFFTGVGKSGYVAQKVAATMMSTGTKALYLSPIDALHGDLGVLSGQDLLIIFSKSGETEELLQLLPSVRNKGARVVALTSNVGSRLARAVDLTVELPCHSELCPFDLAPTTSTEIQLLIGDVFAISLMETKGFSLHAFAENHPGGRIGKRVSIKVKDLMLDVSRAPFCFPHDTLESVLVDFSDKRCGCLVVIDEERRLKGIFTDGDLRRALQMKGEKVLQESLENLMVPTPKAIDADALAWEAMKLMEEDQKHPVTVLPVLENQSKVVGLIKMHDIIQAGI